MTKENWKERLTALQEELRKKHQVEIKQCGEEIEAVLKKYDCRLEPVFVFTSKGMLPPQINIEKNPVQLSQANGNGKGV